MFKTLVNFLINSEDRANLRRIQNFYNLCNLRIVIQWKHFNCPFPNPNFSYPFISQLHLENLQFVNEFKCLTYFCCIQCRFQSDLLTQDTATLRTGVSLDG